MIIVREVFIAKPGSASKLAKLMKEVMAEWGVAKVRVMTDMTGVFNKVVVETEMDNLTDFDKRMKEYSNRPKDKTSEKMAGYTDMYHSGKREIYQVW